MQTRKELEFEVTNAVKHLKTKIACAVIFAIFKKCKAERRNVVEYTASLKKRFIIKNLESLKPEIVQRNLDVWQKEAVDKLQKALPHQISQTQHLGLDTYCDSQNSSISGGSLDWFENKSSAIDHAKVKSDMEIISPFNNKFGMEDVTRNAAFLESILRLTEAGKENSEASSVLHSVLYDTAEHSVSHFSKDSYVTPKKPQQLTEDSGLGYSEGYTEESSNGVGVVLKDVVKYALYSTNTSEPVTLSLSAVVKVLKAKLHSDCEEMFYSWKGSFYEYICNVIRKCSQLNNDCRDIVVNFITEVIGDCWHSRKATLHESTMMKLSIIDQLIWDHSVCNEVIQNIRENISMFNLYLSKNHKDVQILVRTIGMFLSLYRSTCEKIEEYNKKCVLAKGAGGSSKLKTEVSQECAVSEFWMTQWGPKDQEGEGMDLTPPVNDHDIEVLECLIISTIDKYPLVYWSAVEALNAARRLNEGGHSRNESYSAVQCII